MSVKFDIEKHAENFSKQLRKNFQEFMVSIPEEQLKEAASEREIHIGEIREWLDEENNITIKELMVKVGTIHGETAAAILMETMNKIAPNLMEELEHFKNEATKFMEERKANETTEDEEPATPQPDKQPKPDPHKPEITVADNEEITDVIEKEITDEKMEHIQVCIENGLTDEEAEKTTKVSQEIIAHIRRS